MEKIIFYDKTIYVNGNYLKLEVNTQEMKILYNENQMAASDFREFTPFTHVFYVEEKGKVVTYDVTLLITSHVRGLIGRDGWLIYSDDPAFEISGVDSVTNHLLI